MAGLFRAVSAAGITMLVFTLAGPPATAAVPAPVLKWAYGGCTGSPGQWACQRGWYASPAVADLDGDGQPEVIWGGYDLKVVRGSNGGTRASAAHAQRIWPGVAVADLTGDGTLEIVVGRGGDQLSVYRPLPGAGGTLSLSTLWTRNPFGGGEVRTLALADLDGDGPLEIVVGRASGGATRQVNVYDASGHVRPGWPARRDGEPGYGWGMYNENVAVADLDGDGDLEVVAPTDTHYITALDRLGNQLGASSQYNGSSPAGPKFWSQVGVHVLHEIDLQGYAECGGSLPARRLRPNFANSAPAVADLDGDGALEIVVVGDVYDCAAGDPAGDLYHLPFVFKPDRSRFASGGFDWTVLPAAAPGSGPLSQDYTVIENSVQNAVVADLDGDGRQEMLYPSYDGRLHAFWLDKTEHGAWPLRVPAGSGSDSFRFASEPAVADLDGDGQAEVIFASWPRALAGLSGRLHVASSAGVLLHSLDLPAPATFGSSWNGALGAPTLADIDGDAELEVVLGTVASGIVAYDLPGSAGARVLWGTGRGGPRRAGFIPRGALSIADAAVVEGDSGAVAQLTVTLTPPRPATTRVHFATLAGSASPGIDYVETSGTLDFAPGVASRVVSVPLLGDALDEYDETFGVQLSSPSGAVLADGWAQVTLLDDDPLPTLAVTDVVRPEGSSGPNALLVTLSLSAPSGRDVSVTFASADLTARAGSDYLPAGGTLTFAPGTSVRQAHVTVLGDRVLEGDEALRLDLSAPYNLALPDPYAQVTLTNDDAAGFAVADARVAEPRGGPASLRFRVTLAPPPTGPVSVDYGTLDGSASAGADYLPASGTLSFDPLTTEREVSVTVHPDSVRETVETLVLRLANPGGGTPIAVAQAVGRIADPAVGGDFNADGLPDFLWRHRYSGLNAVWFMDGVVAAGASLTLPDTQPVEWRVAGTADFDGDLKTDILWHNLATGALRVWLMDGVQRTADVAPTPGSVPDLNWRSVGSGDFNGDGRADILWRHQVSGRNVVWLMDGLVRLAGVFTTPDQLADLNWQMAGVGDFNADGHPDILWRQTVSGKTVLWLMQGTVRVQGLFTSPDAQTDANWRAVGLGDLTRDGRPDLVWRHALSGTNVVWVMDGDVRTGGLVTNPASLAPDWELVGPR